MNDIKAFQPGLFHDTWLCSNTCRYGVIWMEWKIERNGSFNWQQITMVDLFCRWWGRAPYIIKKMQNKLAQEWLCCVEFGQTFWKNRVLGEIERLAGWRGVNGEFKYLKSNLVTWKWTGEALKAMRILHPVLRSGHIKTARIIYFVIEELCLYAWDT